jgi:pimeloyl-ACP methyl ester carboxylesterase
VCQDWGGLIGLRLVAEQPERFARVVRAAQGEPPRVRAMLGALGQELDMPPRLLQKLRKSLNPLSRYDFGRLASLRHAKDWHAK